MKQPQGPPSKPQYGERTEATWTCDGCGARIQIQVPAAKPDYPHSICTERPAGRYRP